MTNPFLQSLAQEVLAICGDKKLSEIIADLEKTQSAEATVNRILDGTFLEGTSFDLSHGAILLSDSDDEQILRETNMWLPQVALPYEIDNSKLAIGSPFNALRSSNDEESSTACRQTYTISSDSPDENIIVSEEHLDNGNYENEDDEDDNSDDDDDLPSPTMLMIMPYPKASSQSKTKILDVIDGISKSPKRIAQNIEVVDLAISPVQITLKKARHSRTSSDNKGTDFENGSRDELLGEQRRKTDEEKKLSALRKQQERESKKIAKEQEKAAKRAANELEREKKKAAKQADKERNKVTAQATRLRTSKTDWTDELIVEVEESLLASPLGTLIKGCLEPKHCEITSLEHPDLANLICWRRRVKTLWSDDGQSPVVVDNERTSIEKYILVYMGVQEFCERLQESGGMANHVEEIRRLFPQQQLIYLIEGIDSYLKKRKLRKNRKFQEVVRQGLTLQEQGDQEDPQPIQTRRNRPRKEEVDLLATGPGKAQVEEQLILLQIVERCFIIHTNTHAETAEWIGILTTEIATIPYKNQNADLPFWAHNHVQSGADAADTFSRMLQQIQLVSPAVAKGIMAEYPTVRSLYDGWNARGTVAEAELMLSDIEIERTGLASTVRPRYVNSALSKRIFQIFNGNDPNVVIA